jgi:PPOX class probable FMN-dependent enzyme
VTPRGGAAGFARVLDDQHVALPDAKGNNRTDSLRNIVVNPHAGLLFLIPGLGETLRVNGPASLTRDPGLLEDLAHDGRVPTLAVVVEAREVFLHCAKAFIRSGLWKPETWPPRDDLPSAARILRDHTGQTDRTTQDLQGDLDHSYATRLY